MSNNLCRSKIIGECRRIVVKVGTRLLTDGKKVAMLVESIAKLRNRGWRVLLVSSGAVGLGMKIMKIKKRPAKLSQVQALAALGQSKLMSLYEKECGKLGFHAAQLLLTAEDLRDRERHLNVLNCVNALWDQNVLPVVNENDSVSVDELKFGDNDILAALLATMTRSELTVFMTTVNGLREPDPNGNLGERVSLVSELNDEIRLKATNTDDSDLSIGGMSSKLAAAEIITSAGEHLWIVDGRKPGVFDQILNGEDVGTLFVPKMKRSKSKKRWLSFFSTSRGKLHVDDGAANALICQGRSLLAAGITKVEGDFKRGDTVDIQSANGNKIAKGLINYSAEETKLVAGRKSEELPVLIGYIGDEELVHRDNMAILNGIQS